MTFWLTKKLASKRQKDIQEKAGLSWVVFGVLTPTCQSMLPPFEAQIKAKELHRKQH